MGKLISIASGKGGAGKTTITEALATAIHFYEDINVAVIDADEQKSITKDRKADLELLKNGDFSLEKVAKSLLEKGKKLYPVYSVKPTDIKQIGEITRRHDLVFIDIPGSLSIKGVSELFFLLDYAFVPFYVDRKSFNGQMDTILDLKRKLALKETRLKNFAVFFNRFNGTNKTSKNGSYFLKMEEALKALDIVVLPPVYENIKYEREWTSTIKPIPYSASPKSIYKLIESILEIIK